MISRSRRSAGSDTRPTWPIIIAAAAFAAALAIAIATPASYGQSEQAEGRGQMLFLDHGCGDCHTVGTLGTPAGPDLTHVGSKYSAEYLRDWLADPASRRPWAHMPKLQLTRPEIEALAAYLTSRP
jgi:mono/diheme cytochrome c family protein